MYNVKNRKCTNWPQTGIEHLTVKSAPYTLNTYPWGPNFGVFCSNTSRFWDTRSSKIEKCTEWAQTELENLTVKITLYTLHTPKAQILVRFGLRFAVSVIQHVQGRRKSKMHQWPQTELEDLTVKSTLYTPSTYPEAQILVRFALPLAISEMQHVQGQRKLEMHRMTPNWTWRLDSQKYSIYTQYLPLRSKFSSVSLYN